MNGAKGIAMGDGQRWKVGLVNHAGKYLTAETFGFKINAASGTFRKKQLWTIEQDLADDDTVYLRSHTGRYLAGDKKGNATCSSEQRSDAEKFVIRYHPDGSGRWAICNRTTGYFFGGTDENIMCYEKQPGPSEWWFVHLAIHPQINLRNVNRQKYAHLADDGSNLQVTELIPWGRDALLELEFREGRYCIKACDGRYLHRDGSLMNQPNADMMFTIEMKSVGSLTGMAMRDSAGKYLTAVGRDAVMQTRNRTIGKDELFVIEDSQPQVIFTAHNNKMASIKQGIDVTANQDGEWTDKETFQLEFDMKKSQWRMRTADNTYWILADASGIQSINDSLSPAGLFTIEWLANGSVGIRAGNGRYVTARMNGSLYAVSDALDQRETFIMTIINRPLLVLRCEFGFVAMRSASNPRYECNKTAYDVIIVEYSQTAAYYLKGHNGKYWSIDTDGNVTADQAAPQPFIFELRGQSKMAIKAPNGCYIRGEQNGIMSAKSMEVTSLWEY
jgi:hypothetical protein